MTKARMKVAVLVLGSAAACGGGGGDDDDVGPPSGRLMITAARMGELEAMVAGGAPEWEALVANVEAEMDSLDPYRSGPENICTVYLMTGEQRYADAAWTWIDGVMDDADVRYDSYLHYGDYMRQAATVLNYCYEGLTADQRGDLADYLEQWTDELWYANQGSGWGLDDPGNNYHMAFLEGTAFAGYALREAGRAKGEEYVAILLDKLEKAGGVLDYLATRAAGGDWHEGVNYGQRSKQRLFAALSVVAGAGGENYFATRPFFGEAIRYAVYQLQPDGESIYPGGDMTREASMLVSPFDREYVHAATYWLGEGDSAKGVGQMYLDEIVPDYTGPGFDQRSDYHREFLFGREIGQAVAQDSLPTFYRSAGTEWVTSRSGWGADATCVSISGSPMIDQSHAHMDTGSFTIWKGGWQAVDAATYTEAGLPWGADAHNLVHVPGHERRGGEIPGLEAVHDEAGVTYAKVDASNLYRYRPGDGETETMLEEYTRELVYLKPDVVVVYDRVEPKPAGEGYSWRLHFPVQPTASGGRYSASYQGGGMTLVPLAGGAASVQADDDLMVEGSGAWRVEEAAPADGRYLNVVAVASGQAPSPAASAVASSDEVAGARVGEQVVVFSARARGAAVGLPFSYTVADDGVHTHTLVDLAAAVDVEVERAGGAVTVTVSAGSHPPSPAGLLRFSDG
jgi:hypothetical protein